MHTRVASGAVIGLDGESICVEVDISSGMPKTTIVGLPDAAVDEARERVRSAIRNAGAGFPTKRVTVNLAPAHIRKEGAGYDLPIAVGMLVASGQICESAVEDTMFLGELALDGELRHVRGVLPVAAAARDAAVRRLVVPKVDADEAALIEGIDIVAVDSLRDWIAIATEERPLADAIWPAKPAEAEFEAQQYDGHDLADVRGQEHVKRALEIAASGGHNMLMCGPPGAGKTLLASCMPGILPPLGPAEALEVTKIASVAGGETGAAKLSYVRPFRSPHHSISNAGLVGGGQRLRPGEITLAHRGVLFLDELPEFSTSALESLRQPLEDRRVTISRAAGSATYPADITLIAAMNPCPCGNYDTPQPCTCSDGAVHRYRRRISGPVLDRIDLFVDVPRVEVRKLMQHGAPDAPVGEPSAVVRERVVAARARQQERYGEEGPASNASLSARQVREYCIAHMDDTAERLVREAVDRLGLSARGFHRVLKVARTIADLDASDRITTAHVAEAVNYRSRTLT